jgi:hypothetical protein
MYNFKYIDKLYSDLTTFNSTPYIIKTLFEKIINNFNVIFHYLK